MSVITCFFFKQKTAYEMLISDWSSDVCSSDLTSSVKSHKSIITLAPLPKVLQHSLFGSRLQYVLTIRLINPITDSGIRSDGVVSGMSVSVRVDLGGRRLIKKKKRKYYMKISKLMQEQTDVIQHLHTQNR